MPSAAGQYSLPRIREAVKPFRLHYFPRLRSTSDHAAALRKRGDLFAPAIVLTSHQLAGRGRGKNTWWSNEGVLTVTFALPIDQGWQPHQLPLVAGVAVRRAAAELVGMTHFTSPLRERSAKPGEGGARESGQRNSPAVVRKLHPSPQPSPLRGEGDGVQLKWPNDLLFENRKLAGLLCERIDKVDLIGLGLNVNVDPSRAPAAIRQRVTSLFEITGRSFNLSDVLIGVAQHLHAMTARQDLNFVQLLKEYDRHHALVGRNVCVNIGEQLISGRCEGLDRIGRLLLRDQSGLHAVISGQVESF